MTEFAIILPAAGSSTRFGGPKNKLFEVLEGLPVILHSLAIFLTHPGARQIVIPTHDMEGLTSLLEQWFALRTSLDLSKRRIDPRIRLCTGGDCRAGSVRCALGEVSSDIEWVAVHDAARPLIAGVLIDRTLAAAVAHGAAVPALPVHLTIKQANGSLPARVMRTIPRDGLWAMQTPQVMRRVDLVDAFERCPIPLQQITDDVQLLELIGKDVWLVAGEEWNIKITTPMDLKIARMILRAEPDRDSLNATDTKFFVAPPPLASQD